MKVIVLTRGGLRDMPPTRGYKKIPTGVTHIERWWLNPQKSALPIVPTKWLTTRKGRGRRLAKADERS